MATRPPEVMIVAGEVSGDMHAAELVRAVTRRVPGTRFYGIGGDCMQEAGVEIAVHARDMDVMGLAEVIKRIGFFRRVFGQTLDLARERRPDAVVLVDYPGFNLRLAAKLHALGLKVIYFICPQVWAWHRSRIPRMAAVVDRLITIFPFEAKHFEGCGLRADFVGHPLVEAAAAARAEPVEALCPGGEQAVALLPGSRPHEVRRILPVMWAAAGLVARRYPHTRFFVAAPSPRIEQLARGLAASLPEGPGRHRFVSGRTRAILRASRAALVASGTATVEAALMGCPMVVTYRVAPLTYLVGRMLVRLDHIAMVNIIAGRRACPEFVQGAARAPALSEALAPLLEEGPARAAMVRELQRVAAALGPPGAIERAAKVVAEELARGREQTG